MRDELEPFIQHKAEAGVAPLRRQASLDDIVASLEAADRAAMLQRFSPADRVAIATSLDGVAQLGLREPANRFDVRECLRQAGCEAVLDAEQVLTIERLRPEISDLCGRHAPSRAEATRRALREAQHKVARCGEHARLMMALLAEGGIPWQRLMLVAKRSSGADHVLLLISPEEPFQKGSIVPKNGALVVDTWAAEPFKLAFLADDVQLESHMNQLLRQVDPRP